MKSAGKTSKLSSFIAALCILLYIGAIAFGALQLIINMGERQNLAEKEFYDLADRATSSSVFLGFMTEAYQATIRDYLGASDILLGVIITGSSGEYAFEKYPGSGIVWTADSPRFKKGLGYPDESFFLPLGIEGQRNVTIQAIYGRIDYVFFQKILRQTLIVILSSLLLAFITLLVERTIKNRANYYKKDNKGLYNPRGNIGWDSYANDRLASELNRCSSSEQDLVFLAMELTGTKKVSDGLYNLFADEAVDFFTTRDMIFGKGENGITVIMPNTGLDQGIIKSEQFHSRLIAKLKELNAGQSGAPKTELNIGLSSRSGRLIEADRLILEAYSALEKAVKEPASHIIAFKSDPEKYREFIKANH